jgi:YVTN family beta-propeller protein
MGAVYENVLTMNGASNSIIMIDVSAEKVVAAIPLPGQPESAASDGEGTVFVNLEDKAQIAEVDMRSRSVMRTWELAGCTGPTGLAIDKVDARAFSGCHNGVLIVVDAESGRNIRKLPIGPGVDAVAYDENLHLVFTSNKEGSISVIAQAGADSYSNRETVTTIPGAKTMALDPVRHIVYTVGNRDGQFALLEAER